jgi:hypothetical protein
VRVFLALPDAGLPAEVRATMEAAAAGARHVVLPALPDYLPGIAQSERNRFLTTVDRMLEAELLLADVSEESHSVAWCIAWFLAKGRLVVLTCRKDARGRLSAMLGGNPSPWQKTVLYESPADLGDSLAAVLRF